MLKYVLMHNLTEFRQNSSLHLRRRETSFSVVLSAGIWVKNLQEYQIVCNCFMRCQTFKVSSPVPYAFHVNPQPPSTFDSARYLPLVTGGVYFTLSVSQEPSETYHFAYRFKGVHNIAFWHPVAHCFWTPSFMQHSSLKQFNIILKILHRNIFQPN
jgi:hypothetical protein